ncbi:MAG TPA: FUSC family protein [Amnibacterium sp.]|nr:FUSC family protein [Amnibacterium sp.]
MARRDLAPRLLDATLHRFQPLAPDWLVRVVAPKQAPVPWADMVRVAVSVTTPLAVGVVAGQPGIGGLAAMGALLGAFGDSGGPFARRFRRASIGLAGGLLGLLGGRLLLGTGLAAVPVAALFGVVSALVSGINAEFSFGGLQLLVYLAISSGPAHAVPPPVLAAAVTTGAAWSMLLSFVQTRVVPVVDRPPLAVAAVLDELIALLQLVGKAERPSDDELRQARRRISIAVGRAYDAVAAARATAPGRRADLRRLSGVLSAVTQLAAVAADAATTDPAEAAAVVPEIAALRDAVAHGRRRVPDPTGAAGRTGSALARAVAQLARAGSEADARVAGSMRRRARAVVGEALTGRRTWLFAIRLGLVLAVAELAMQLLPLDQPYWVLLTAAVVLKPDFGSVFARGLQRTLGTFVGVLIGSAVLVTVPRGPLLLIPVAVFALLFPFGASRNFGMLSTFLTPLVLLLVEFGGATTAGVAAGRLIDTAIGAAIVLLVGYLPWPETWRLDIDGAAAGALDALADYAAVALSAPPAVVAPARRRAYGALANLRSELQSALAEPTPRARAASAWYPLVTQLEQIADDLRDVSILDRRVAASPLDDLAQPVVEGLRDLADAVREHRPPKDTPLPELALLAGAASGVAAVRRLLIGFTG